METLRKYILYFLVGIAICLVGASGVFADTTFQSFSGFNSTATSYNNSLNYNNDVYAVESVDMYNYEMSFEWTSTNTKTCSTGAVVSGNLRIEKLSMGITNQDFSWNNVYIVNNNNKSNCSWQVHDTYTSYICSLDSLNTNFKIGYTLNPMGGQFTYSSYIFRNIDISCDTSTSQIIENNSQNTQNIINNNNQNTQAIIDSNKVCTNYDKVNVIEPGIITTSGTLSSTSSTSYGVTDYISITSSAEITILQVISQNLNIGFYDINKTFISYFDPYSSSINDIIPIPSNASYVRFSINKVLNKPQYKVCKNGSQATTDAINGLDDTLNDDDTSGATSEASDFFSDFNTNTFGLTSIITAPLNLIQSLTSSTCNDLELPLPYLNNKKLILPCMTTIYSTHFGSFFTIYQTITYGIIAYWVCVRIFNLVKDFKNPEHDEIEVLDL